MNWDAIGAIAELLGAVGVIASLVYLATQIRQNTATVRASGSAAQSKINETVPVLLAQHAAARELYVRGLQDYESLTAEEARQFEAVLGLTMNGLQQSQFLRTDGALPDDAWNFSVKTLRWHVGLPSFRHFWDGWGTQYADGFITLVKEILAEDSDREESPRSDAFSLGAGKPDPASAHTREHH